FSGPNPINLLDGQNEDLAVADFPGCTRRKNCLDCRLNEVIGHSDLQSHFIVQLHLHGGAAISLHLLSLATVAAHPADGETSYLGAIKRFEYVVQFFGSDYGENQFHLQAPSAWTRIAPSPLLYASSPCWLTSRPIPSSFALARRLNAKPIALMMT